MSSNVRDANLQVVNPISEHCERTIQSQECQMQQDATPASSAAEKAYSHEEVLKEGVQLVRSLKAAIDQVDLGSNAMRKDVWGNDIQGLLAQESPNVLIAVCGATGAGKSSLLNAILDDNVVPTNGIRACTAVVTEIRYHAKATIDGEVFFLTENEWRAELAILLDDLVDQNGNLKRNSDLRGDAAIAWSKVRAVYPSISPEQLIRMSVDEIINSDQNTPRLLGTIQNISASDSKTFRKKVNQYVDSRGAQRRIAKDKNGKGKGMRETEKRDASKRPDSKQIDGPTQKTVAQSDQSGKQNNGAHRSKSKKQDKDAKEMQNDKKRNRNSKESDIEDKDKQSSNNLAAHPVYWPLIREVHVRCSSKALSTGAILVDLPGVADANAARNNIATEYLKKCNYTWIAAPVTRAVDDKTARDLMGNAFKMQLVMDGNYDASAITFIATKCDDISCSEVISMLGLQHSPEFKAIKSEIERCKDAIAVAHREQAKGDAVAKGIHDQIQQLSNILKEHKEHLAALEKGNPFEPHLTALSQKHAIAALMEKNERHLTVRNLKRKNKKNIEERSSKRPRVGESSNMLPEHSTVLDDEDMDVTENVKSDNSDFDSDSESSTDSGSNSGTADSEAESDSACSGTGSSGESEHVNEPEEVMTIERLKEEINEIEGAIRAKQTSLSLYESQRKGRDDRLASLRKKEIEVQRKKNAFCSLKRSEHSTQVLKDDFRTGLKELNDAEEERNNPDTFDPSVTTRDYSSVDLPVFTCSARDYVRIRGQVKGDGDPTCFSNVDDTGIPSLQEWCHQLTVSHRSRAVQKFLTQITTFTKSVRSFMEGIGNVIRGECLTMKKRWESPSCYRGSSYLVESQTQGVAARLDTEFKGLVEDCVKGLRGFYEDRLEEKCAAGAQKAAEAALDVSDAFASSMHWTTYRATLKRYGCHTKNLNIELVEPFTSHIAISWATMFQSNLLGPFEEAAIELVKKVLADVAATAAIGLKDRTEHQVLLCLEEARVALHDMVNVVRENMDVEQKSISRSLSPQVKSQLQAGYERALKERGFGSVARQKAAFRDTLQHIKDHIFMAAAENILDSLSKAADAMGVGLTKRLDMLTRKIEVNISVLWEEASDDPKEREARAKVSEIVSGILEWTQRWKEADSILSSPQVLASATNDVEMPDAASVVA